MFIKLLTGPRAGEVFEMKYADAKALIDDGRAVLAFPPDPPAVPTLTEAVIKPVGPLPKAKRKGFHKSRITSH
jgi:hypothetical protein